MILLTLLHTIQISIALKLGHHTIDLQNAFVHWGAIGVLSCFAPFSANAMEWNFANGNVKIDETITLSSRNKVVSLQKPELIGSGGGGAVFSFRDSSSLLKVSWEGSSKSVERECEVLQKMEARNIQGVERCLGKYQYNDSKRAMILVEPYIRDTVASVMEVSPSMQIRAVEQISHTLVQMLAANIVTIDVQPLISKVTGDVTFIDMTEAQVLSQPYSSLDKVLMSSFISEMVNLVPEKYEVIAFREMLNELHDLNAKGIDLSVEAMDLLQSQTFVLDDGNISS